MLQTHGAARLQGHPLRAGHAAATPPPSPEMPRLGLLERGFFFGGVGAQVLGMGCRGGWPCPPSLVSRKTGGEGAAGSCSGENINFGGLVQGWGRGSAACCSPARGHGLATHRENEWAAPTRGDKRHNKGR